MNPGGLAESISRLFRNSLKFSVSWRGAMVKASNKAGLVTCLWYASVPMSCTSTLNPQALLTSDASPCYRHDHHS